MNGSGARLSNLWWSIERREASFPQSNPRDGIGARLVGALFAFATVASASAAIAQDEPALACPPAFLRWQEDCRGLAGKDLQGLDRLRLRQLAGQATLSFGAEARSRVEGFDNPDFGLSGPDYLSVAGRALVHADLRTHAGPRVFVQLSAADEEGREPGPRPFDVSGVDLAQGFVDCPAGSALRTRLCASVVRSFRYRATGWWRSGTARR
jgi:hypothetical protein